MPEEAHADIFALSDLCTPWCVHVVATLRIAEHIEAGISDIAGLAAAAEQQSSGYFVVECRPT